MSNEAGMSEVGLAELLVREERWKEAMSVLDSILKLPTETDNAAERLEELTRASDVSTGQANEEQRRQLHYIHEAHRRAWRCPACDGVAGKLFCANPRANDDSIAPNGKRSDDTGR